MTSINANAARTVTACHDASVLTGHDESCPQRAGKTPDPPSDLADGHPT
jgi:hypothetical protein